MKTCDVFLIGSIIVIFSSVYDGIVNGSHSDALLILAMVAAVVGLVATFVKFVRQRRTTYCEIGLPHQEEVTFMGTGATIKRNDEK